MKCLSGLTLRTDNFTSGVKSAEVPKMFARAGQPELVRSNQKDVYYLGFLREGIGQIYRNFQGKTMYKVMAIHYLLQGYS